MRKILRCKPPPHPHRSPAPKYEDGVSKSWMRDSCGNLISTDPVCGGCHPLPSTAKRNRTLPRATRGLGECNKAMRVVSAALLLSRVNGSVASKLRTEKKLKPKTVLPSRFPPPFLSTNREAGERETKTDNTYYTINSVLIIVELEEAAAACGTR